MDLRKIGAMFSATLLKAEDRALIPYRPSPSVCFFSRGGLWFLHGFEKSQMDDTNQNATQKKSIDLEITGDLN
jgi:hypothetical protein